MDDYFTPVRKSWEEEKVERQRKLKKHLCYSTPFFLGCIAYLNFYPGDYLDAAYFALRNYIMEYGQEEKSFLLELSRWSAFLVATTIIVEVFCEFGVNIKAFIKLLFSRNFVAVFGSNTMTPYLEKSFQKSNIKGCVFSTKSYFLHIIVKLKKVKHYVIMFDSPEENLAFYSRYITHFHDDCSIHINLEEINPHFFYHEAADVYHFGFADLAARSFWSEVCTDLNPHLLKNEHVAPNYIREVVKIVIIGTGLVLEKLLDYALQVNIFDPNQKIEYHIFGDMEKYEALHYNLEKDGDSYVVFPKDRLFFHGEPWTKQVVLLNQANKIIICEETDADTLTTASHLRSHFNMKGPLYLQLRDGETLSDAMKDTNKLVVFGARSSICTAQNITNDQLIRRAQALAEHYATKSDNRGNRASVPKIEPWLKMTNFTRDSNLFAAFYWSIMLQGKTENPQRKEKEFFSELEHIRWYRFHQMNNWLPSATRDNGKRMHHCLVDFSELEQGDKDKDAEVIQVIQTLEELRKTKENP